MEGKEENLAQKDYIVHLYDNGFFHILERILTSLPLTSLSAFRRASSGMNLIRRIYAEVVTFEAV